MKKADSNMEKTTRNLEKADNEIGKEYTKDELHNLIRETQPNICQITANKDNRHVYSDCWNDYKIDDVHFEAYVFKRLIDNGGQLEEPTDYITLR